MKATYKKAGFNYLPAINHGDRIEALWGDPLPTIAAAKKFAQLTINERRVKQ